MKKTIREYLTERRDMACHNLFCYSATYGMDTPKEGCEAQFAEAQRDVEIVDELIRLTEDYPTSDDPDIFNEVTHVLEYRSTKEEILNAFKTLHTSTLSPESKASPISIP